MQRSGVISARRRALAGWALAGAFVVWCASGWGGAGCTLILDTDINPHKCMTDADCTGLPNAVCDNAHKMCVPRLPLAGPDGGAPIDTGAGGSGALACELSFDNGTRLYATGPDGGLRPLPEGP